jgi:hypothetical protein
MSYMALSQPATSPAFASGSAAKPLVAVNPWAALRTQIVNVPTSGFLGPAFCVEVPESDLARGSIFGAVLVTAIPRTQGTIADLYRGVLLDFAKDYGKVRTTSSQAVVETTKPLSQVVDDLRERSGLPAADVARMAGIQRRQLYYLADGGKTSTSREQRIRLLAQFVDRLFEQFGDPSTVRSALLAPVGRDLRSFVDLTTDGGSVQDATRILGRYLAARQSRVRHYVQTPRRARKHEQVAAKLIDTTSDIAPDTD